MPRILYVSMVGWLVLSSTQVAAQQPAAPSVPTVARAAPARTAAPKILPGTPSSVFSTIQGNALTSMNGSLPNALVRLRDARVGQIVETQLTDQSGLFVFRSLDPGSYIVEIVDRDQKSILAASEVLLVGPSEAVSTLVKLPFRVPLLGRLLGSSAPAATAITTQAAVAGVLAAQASGAPTCDPSK